MSYSVTEPIYKFDNGWGIYRVPDEDALLEGRLMRHCMRPELLNDRYRRAYSLRNTRGIPYATIMVTDLDLAPPCIRLKRFILNPASAYDHVRDLGTDSPMYIDGQEWVIVQCRGFRDQLPAYRYWKMVREWFESMGGEGASWERTKANTYNLRKERA